MGKVLGHSPGCNKASHQVADDGDTGHHSLNQVPLKTLNPPKEQQTQDLCGYIQEGLRVKVVLLK